MRIGRVKCLLVAAFSLLSLSFPAFSHAQQHEGGETAHEATVHLEDTEKEGEKKFDANEVIFGHVMDAHEFHFFSYKGSDGQDHHATIPLDRKSVV